MNIGQVVFTPEQVSFIADKRKRKFGWIRISEDYEDAFGEFINARSLENKWNNFLRIQVPKIVCALSDDKTGLVENLISQNNSLQKELTKERIKTAQIVEACTTSLAKQKFEFVPQPRKSTVKKSENMSMHLYRSDAQVGEVVEPEITGGLGRYNFGVYKKRVEKLRHKVSKFFDQDHRSLGLEKLISPQLGDHVEGENIYRGQAFYIDRPLVDQLFESVREEIKFWLHMATMFRSVELYCVAGNHGRPGRKGDNHQKTNWDYVYYQTIKMNLESRCKHIKVFVSESPTMLVEHGNFLFCYNHGDNIHSWMSLPYYGLERMARRTTKLFNKIIDYYCIGHFHTPANIGDEILVNGCMPGGSQFSINKMGVSSRPSQLVHYFHDKHGMNRQSYLYLDDDKDMKELEADKNGIFTPISKNALEGIGEGKKK